MPRLWDISPRLGPETPVWPGDTPFTTRQVMSMEEGAAVNVGAIDTTLHAGAHADAPYHFLAAGAAIADCPLEPYLGPCRLVESLGREPLAQAGLEGRVEGAERLLIRTRPPGAGNPFEEGFASLAPETAHWLAGLGIRLVGLDTPSVDEFDSKEMGAHLALLARGVAILENLDLGGVPEGDYELIALPLPLEGMDGSPVRAVLREREREDG
jgi:arylformamidase